MTHSEEMLRKKSRSPQEYERGEELFEQGKVKLLSRESFWKGEEKIRALVEDGEKSFRVSALMKKGYLYQAVCQCPVHREYKGLCRHVTAAVLSVMEVGMEESAPRVSTPIRVRRMLKSYTEREMREAVIAGMEEKVRLEPTLKAS